MSKIKDDGRPPLKYYEDKCPECGSIFKPETPCDFGYCYSLLEPYCKNCDDSGYVGDIECPKCDDAEEEMKEK